MIRPFFFSRSTQPAIGRGSARLDDAIRALAVGQLFDFVEQVFPLDIDGQVGAELLRAFKPALLTGIDPGEQNLAGAQAFCRVGGENADRPAALHDDKVIEVDLPVFCNIVDRNGKGLAKGDHFKAQALGDAVQKPFGHGDVVRHGTIDAPAEHQLRGAEVHPPGTAKIAHAAGIDARFDHHAVSDFVFFAGAAGFFNDAGQFMPQDDRRPVGKDILPDMDVRAADPAGLDPDHHPVFRRQNGLFRVKNADVSRTCCGLHQCFHMNPSRGSLS